MNNNLQDMFSRILVFTKYAELKKLKINIDIQLEDLYYVVSLNVYDITGKKIFSSNERIPNSMDLLADTINNDINYLSEKYGLKPEMGM